MAMETTITVAVVVQAPLARVWECWTGLDHVAGWAFASDDWAAKGIENDLRVGGSFKNHLFAKDGSFSFDFEGVYSAVEPLSRLAFLLSDGRKASVAFSEVTDGVRVEETFEPEGENPVEMQRDGWQAFLDSFKRYVEGR